jgi:hypothetical protein
MENSESKTGEKIFGFFSFGDKKCIQILLLEEFFDLFASPFIVEERMFRIDINIDSPAIRDFLYGFEYLI